MAYLQGALHADELPGVLMLDHLAGRLDVLDAEGSIPGEIVLLPYANPIGFDQSLGNNLIGRFRFADGGGNFNRAWPDLAPAAAERVRGKLGDDPVTNTALVREALRQAADELPISTEREAHQKALISRSIGADLVFDLHCDWRATLHLYANRDHADEMATLGADMGIPVMLIDDQTDALTFDSANGLPWQRLRDILGVEPASLPSACFAATIELRGQMDVTDELAAADAENLLRYLMRTGVVAGDPGPLPQPLGEPTSLAAMLPLTAPAAGIVVWQKALGEQVEIGDRVAEIVEVGDGAVPAPRHPVIAEQSGILFSIHHEPLHRPGDRIGKIAGRDPILRRPGQKALSNR